MDQREALRINNVFEQYQITKQSLKYLQHSYEKVKTLQSRLETATDLTQFSMEELDDLEAFSARFARCSDICIQKLFRAIDHFELIQNGSIIDRLNRMEKNGIIQSAEVWKNIREDRNEIAHDYVLEDNRSFYLQLIQNTPAILAIEAKIENWLALKNLRS